MRILIIGGTGFIGSSIAARLAAAGHTQTVVTRHREQHASLLVLPLLALVEADVHDPAALAGLVSEHDAVINLVGILHGDAARFEHTHVALTEKIVAACEAAGVRRYLHMSALGAGVDAPSLYQRSKGRAEAGVAASGLDWTIFRPSVVFGRDDRFLNLFARLQQHLPLLPLAGAGVRFQPVWVEDVSRAFAVALERNDLIRQRLDLVGPRIYTLAELVRLAGRWSQHPRPVLPLPDAIARVEATLMALLPDPPLTHDNLDSMKIDNVAAGGFPAVLGWAPQALESVAPGYLAPPSPAAPHRGPTGRSSPSP
ncbi:complex I NDUFA9 subunit family protein [Jeongeupia chitinilytica]|uniref:Complex I NDUFA9 subunit family protein n=1 Tax=Jeongeupia chitinilytica TaxID=1041641 RepID=A0ABQ3H1U5_9NEIS|nr:complex I NDUFA9 subunit family protein [Jeongeupia chitinilytica]GHD61552.1 complex I NDUFA9 subunit family protein [Jeongeupia chitinilytica]